MGPLSHGGRGDAHRQCRGLQVAGVLSVNHGARFCGVTRPGKHTYIAIEHGHL